MEKTRQFLVKLLSEAGVPRVGEVDKLLSNSKLLEPAAVALSEIASFQPMGRASLLKPPWGRLAFASGQGLDLGILAGVRHPNIHPANNAAFDDFHAKLQVELARIASASVS